MSQERLRAAIECMRRLQPFDPRLTGLLAAGVEPPAEDFVHILTVAEHVDALGGHFETIGIPTRMVERKAEAPRAAAIRIPGYAFLAGNIEFRVWVLSEAQSRQRLRFLSDPCAYPRLTLKAVQKLLDTDPGLIKAQAR